MNPRRRFSGRFLAIILVLATPVVATACGTDNYYDADGVHRVTPDERTRLASTKGVSEGARPEAVKSQATISNAFSKAKYVAALVTRQTASKGPWELSYRLGTSSLGCQPTDQSYKCPKLIRPLKLDPRDGKFEFDGLSFRMVMAEGHVTCRMVGAITPEALTNLPVEAQDEANRGKGTFEVTLNRAGLTASCRTDA